MLKIRLQRVGRKHEPTFRVVLTDKRNSTKSGRFLEVLGHHDPRGERQGALEKERILHFISKGAQPTETVHNLLVKRGIIKGEKIDVSAKKKKGKGEAETVEPSKPPQAGVAPKAESEKKEPEVKVDTTESKETIKEGLPADLPAREAQVGVPAQAGKSDEPPKAKEKKEPVSEGPKKEKETKAATPTLEGVGVPTSGTEKDQSVGKEEQKVPTPDETPKT